MKNLSFQTCHQAAQLARIALFTVLFVAISSSAFAVNGSWNLSGDASGAWGTPVNWSSNPSIPSGTDAIATFNQNITATSTITLDAPRNIGTINFTDATTASNNWILSTGTAGGALVLDSAGAAGTINVTNQTATISAIISSNDNEGLTKIGAGTLVLSNGSNTYTGLTTITAGTLSFASGALDSTSGIVMNSGILQWNGVNTQDISSKLTMLTGVNATFDTGANNVTFASGIGNGTTATLTKVGSGTLTLSGANTYTGKTVVDGGTLTIGATGTLASSSLNLASGTFNYASSTAKTYSGSITGGGSLTTAATTGTLTLSGANTFTGGTTLNGGTLILANQLALQNSSLTMNSGSVLVFDQSVAGNAFTLGGLAGSVGITLQNNAGSPVAIALTVGGNNANTTYSGALSGAGSLTKTGTGTLTLSGANSYSGTTTVNNGYLSFSNLSAVSSLAAGSITVNTSGSVVGSGAFSNITNWLASGKIDTASTGSIAISGNSSENINFSTAGYNSLGLSSSGGNFTYSGTITTGSNGYIFGGAANTLTVSSALTGANALTKNGTSTLILSNAANTYSGGTTINDGYLTFSVAGAVPATGSITVNTSGSLVASGAQTTVMGWLSSGKINTASTGSIAITANSSENIDFSTAGYNSLGLSSSGGNFTYSGTLTPGSNGYIFGGAANTLTVSSALTGANALIKNGTSALTLTNTGNTYSGGTTVNAGVLNAGNAGSTVNPLGTGAITVNSGGTITFGSSRADFTVSPLQIFNINGAGAAGQSGALVLGGNLSFSAIKANINLQSNATIGTSNSVGNGNSISGGTITLNSNTLTFNPLTPSGGLNSEALTINNVITGIGGSIIQNGPGVTTLSGANTYTGTTTILLGTLVANNAGTAGTSGSLGKNSAVTLANDASAILQLNAAVQIGSLAGGGNNGGNVVLGANTLTLGGDNTNTSYAGIISGTGGITKIGSGTQTLTGANTYSGVFTVSSGNATNGGTVNISGDQSAATGGWSINGSSTVNFLSGSTIVVGAGKTISFTNGGGNNRILNVAGTVTTSTTSPLSNPGGNAINLNAGANWTQNGTMSFQPNQTFTDAVLTVNTGATFTYANAATINWSNSINTNGGSAILNLNGGTFITQSGFDNGSTGTAGSANLNLSNGGTLKLSADITSLATSSGGKPFNIKLGTNAAGAVGGIIDTNGFSTAIDLAISDLTTNGSLTKQGAGTLKLTGANTYTGTTTISNGVLLANNASGSATGSGAVSVGAAGALGGTGTVVTSGLTVAGLGTLRPGDPAAAGGIGSLAVTGNVTLAAAGSSVLDLQITHTNGVNGLYLDGGGNLDWATILGAAEVGSASDHLNISGALTLNTTGTTTVNFSAADVGTFQAGMAWDLVDWGSILNNTPASYNYNFAALNAELSGSGLTLDTSRFWDTGYIGVVAVPEPGRLLLLSVGFASLALRRRRKKEGPSLI